MRELQISIEINGSKVLVGSIRGNGPDDAEIRTWIRD